MICFCGIDGTGKTKHLRLMERRAQLLNLPHKYVVLGLPAFFSYPFLAVCRALGYTERPINPRDNQKYVQHNFYKNQAISFLYPWFYLTDFILFSFWRVYVSLFLSHIVLCDRCAIDALVDLTVETGDYSLPARLVGRLLLSLIPNNSSVLLFDVDEEEAFIRKKDTPSLAYLSQRRHIFTKLAKMLDIPLIDTSPSFEAVENEIKRHVSLPARAKEMK